MKKFHSFFLILTTIGAIVFSAATAGAQDRARETFQGTVISYGSGRRIETRTDTFTLTINRQTSDQQVQRFLGTLQEGGQDDLLREIRGENLGFFSLGGQLGRRLNVVRESVLDGRRRIFAVFERWVNFGELRGGYRSTDYPFSVIEIVIDPRTGRGEGTFIAAARIRWDTDRRTGQNQVEIENFATFPSRLIGITRRNR